MLLKLPTLRPKRILGDCVIPRKESLQIPIFIHSLIIVGPPNPTSKPQLKFSALKTCPNCIVRSWNSSIEKPEREELHS